MRSRPDEASRVPERLVPLWRPARRKSVGTRIAALQRMKTIAWMFVAALCVAGPANAQTLVVPAGTPAAALSAPIATTPSYESVARIRAAALAQLQLRDASAQAGDIVLDEQLRLPACPDAALAAAFVREGTVEVGCTASGWRLYVPYRNDREQAVWVLARPVAAGEPVSQADLRQEMRAANRMTPSALTDPAQIAGRVARRGLAAGAVLSSTDLVAARSVRRGDEVTLLARHGDIVVRARGKALGEGGEREQVRVENLQSRRVVTGTILASGEVEVIR